MVAGVGTMVRTGEVFTSVALEWTLASVDSGSLENSGDTVRFEAVICSAIRMIVARSNPKRSGKTETK